MYLLLMIQFSLFILFVDQRSKSDEISGKIYLWTVHLFRRYKFQLVDTRARHFAISAFRKNDECWPCKVRLLSKKGTIRKRAKLYRATLTNPLTSYILFIIFTYCISKYVNRNHRTRGQQTLIRYENFQWNEIEIHEIVNERILTNLFFLYHFISLFFNYFSNEDNTY